MKNSSLVLAHNPTPGDPHNTAYNKSIARTALAHIIGKAGGGKQQRRRRSTRRRRRSTRLRRRSTRRQRKQRGGVKISIPSFTSTAHNQYAKNSIAGASQVNANGKVGAKYDSAVRKT